jgi:3-hydroxybutyryl-CoA dehydrogenase
VSERFEHVLVVGAGQMGGGIAQVMAASGRRVSLYDAAPGAVERGLETMRKSLAKLAEKGGPDPDEVLARVEPVDDLVAADLMVEAVVEDEAVKLDVFRRADPVLPPGAILASNTSSIPIATLGAASGRPDRVIGMHFFNPVPVMGLVELTPSAATSEETFALVEAFATEVLAKTCVRSSDEAGFIVNRLLIPYLFDAIRLYERGFATREDIDTAIHLGLAHPMGPLRLSDLIGLDTVASIGDVLHRAFGDQRYEAPALLRTLVAEGRLGRKTGEGFYTY